MKFSLGPNEHQMGPLGSPLGLLKIGEGKVEGGTMEIKLEELDTKIAKLKERKKRIEEETIKRLASCVNRVCDQIDMGTLIGLILDAPKIINENKNKKEVWQIVGEKFLLTTSHKTKSATSQNHPTHQPL